jgi:hypothetical protein
MWIRSCCTSTPRLGTRPGRRPVGSAKPRIAKPHTPRLRRRQRRRSGPSAAAARPADLGPGRSKLFHCVVGNRGHRIRHYLDHLRAPRLPAFPAAASREPATCATSRAVTGATLSSTSTATAWKRGSRSFSERRDPAAIVVDAAKVCCRERQGGGRTGVTWQVDGQRAATCHRPIAACQKVLRLLPILPRPGLEKDW